MRSIPFEKQLKKLYWPLLGERKELWFLRRNLKRFLHSLSHRDYFSKSVFVYDCAVSPPTYGDFFDYLMLAVLCQRRGVYIDFYILNDAYRLDWTEGGIVGELAKCRVKEFRDIAVTFLSDGTSSVSIKDFKDIVQTVANYNNKVFLRDFILRREGIYELVLWGINRTDDDLGFPLADSVWKEACSNRGFTLPFSGDYISWHIRAGSKWSCDEDDDIEDCKRFLDKLMTYSKIPVIICCNPFSVPLLSVLERNNVYFSKEFSSGFIDDALISIGSKLFVQNGGGGLFTVVTYFNSNYYISEKCAASWEKRRYRLCGLNLDRGKLRKWSAENQVIYRASDFSMDFISKLLRRDVSNGA